MFHLLLFVAMPLLVGSVLLGWWAHKKPFSSAYKVLVGQLMVDSLIISIFLMIYFDRFSMIFLIASAGYAFIISMRLRELFTRMDAELNQNSKP
jgi:hypothetical protein